MRTQGLIFCLCVLIVTGVFSCGQSGDDDASTPGSNPGPIVDLATSRGEVVMNTANQIILPGYDALKLGLEEMVTTFDAFTQTPDSEHLAAARKALKRTWLAWQEVAPFQFGPAETVALRQAANIYPTDVDKVNNNIAKGDYILGAIDNQAAVGLPAIDYLLNGLSEDPDQVIEYYSTDGFAANRGRYLKDLVNHLLEKVTRTLHDWDGTSDTYLTTFTSESAFGTDVGSSMGLIINAIDLHFQRSVRDGKVGIPAGVRSAGVSRPRATEALYGNYSHELLLASLEAYKDLFMGIGLNEKDEKGLYDYLVDLEEADLANDIRDQFEATLALVKNLNAPINEVVETDLEVVTNIFLEMQKLVPLLKSDMASVMGIIITNQDNDGD